MGKNGTFWELRWRYTDSVMNFPSLADKNKTRFHRKTLESLTLRILGSSSPTKLDKNLNFILPYLHGRYFPQGLNSSYDPALQRDRLVGYFRRKKKSEVDGLDDNEILRSL